MDFFGAVRICFNKYVNFGGRASRSEFWLFVLFVVLGGLILGVIDGVVGVEQGDPVSLGNAFGLLTFLPGLAVAVRRLHDTNRSGWWYLISFTIIGYIPLLYWWCVKGEEGENRFGLEPRASTQDATMSITNDSHRQGE
ncbi:MAG: hypothetical protein CMO31_00605 [Trueperaceae bacterium]|jgi:uncharacterized membrane protein YhaH (DUF805 family)|nr:hypothetical protein [Trueperaceae bacterium]|tara:strand:- start:20672 stop:21088 length:417 start_codon:yes stop_codon:yes gene_type:complete